MSDRHVITVYGSPVAQSRAGRRHFILPGGRPCSSAYDPVKSKDWKRTVQSQVLDSLNGQAEIHEGPLSLQLRFYLARPKSLPKRVMHHIKKPDADNLAKGVKDAMRGILYHDDSQIVELLIRKEYNAQPRVVIAMEILNTNGS